MSIVNEIKVDFLSVPENEGFARLTISAFLLPLNPTMSELSDVKTAVSEAVTNAVVHAYPEKLGMVMLRVRILPDERLEIVVKDHGVGIPDVEKAKTPLYTTGGEERSGMGFTVMDSFMDSIDVASKVGSGTTVRLYKQLESGRPAAKEA